MITWKKRNTNNNNHSYYHDQEEYNSLKPSLGMPTKKSQGSKHKYNLNIILVVALVLCLLLNWRLAVMNSLARSQNQQQQKQHQQQPPPTYYYNDNIDGMVQQKVINSIQQQQQQDAKNFHHVSFVGTAGKISSNVTIISTLCNNANSCQFRNNSIVILAQKKHSTYNNRDSFGFLIDSLTLLKQNYLAINNHATNNVDLFIFHTGDFTTNDLVYIESTILGNLRPGIVKLVNLVDTVYWTLPPWHAKDNQSNWALPDVFPVGYRHMCRWFGIKIWQFYKDMNTQLGTSYRFILRIDEDSRILSPISYDIFDYMKYNQFVYGYRLCAYELDYNRFVAPWFGRWQVRNANHINRDINKSMCGFYNNFFVADLYFFQSMIVQRFLKEIDRQGIIYRKRYGDLMIHTIAVYAFAPSKQIHRFLDFTYEHVTILENNCVVWGGIQAGYNDLEANEHLKEYYQEKVLNRNCTANTTYITEPDLSPTYQHVPNNWKGKVKLKTITAGKVELNHQGILSG